MPYADIETNRIVDAKEGTLSWFHEEGHLVFSKTDKSIQNSFKQSFYFYLAVTFVIFGIASLMGLNKEHILISYGIILCAVIFIIFFWFYYIYEEVWCWKYAFKKRKENKK